jgi:hypothetical protein
VLVRIVLGLTALSTSAFAVAFVAPAGSNIFAAGFGTTAGVGDGSGTLPPSISFAAGGGTLTFSGFTGTISCGPFCTNETIGPTSNGPDGASYNAMQSGATTINAPGNGISGITFVGRELFLVGVFLGDTAPSGPGPANWVYSTNFADNATQFWPGIAQVFYIGNGLTGGPNDPPGVIQTFNIPVSATRLFFGFADATGFVGTPGMFNDNTGSISGNVNLSLAPAPEPGTVLLMGLGFVGLALLRRNWPKQQLFSPVTAQHDC